MNKGVDIGKKIGEKTVEVGKDVGEKGLEIGTKAERRVLKYARGALERSKTPLQMKKIH